MNVTVEETGPPDLEERMGDAHASLRLYDRLSDSVRPFHPVGSEVTLYVCGLTPYDATHLGHAFTFVAFDVLIRYLEYLGYPVRYVQNVTDIDDPLFAKARELGVSHWDLANEEMSQYFDDMRALNVLPAEVYPRASREVSEMVSMVEELVRSGHGYVVDGHVYYSIATDGRYGELSRYDRETMIEIARERGGNPDDPLRQDPLDFLLWRPSGDGEPSYESPWGAGLPGWHLECSAMSRKYLGVPLDIHGGGADLIFPHHENEIAQSEAATGVRPFARFWMHTGMVYLGGEKMSKSLGNMVFVRDLVPRYGADAVRLALSLCHYRGRLDYDESKMLGAVELSKSLNRALALESVAGVDELDVALFRDQFLERLNDDLDTPGAVGVLDTLARRIVASHGQGTHVSAAQYLLRELGGILGLRFETAR